MRAGTMLLAGIGVLIGLQTAAPAQEPTTPTGALHRAWQEYEFQAHDLAEKYFTQARESFPEASAGSREAALGLAMVGHFREKGRDLEGAAAQYESLLEAGVEGTTRLLTESMFASALAELGELERANDIWDEIITANPDTLIAQDALMSRTLANMGPYDSPQTGEAIRYLQEKRALFPEPTREDPAMAPSYDELLGEAYFWRGEYRKSRDAFIRYVEIGTIRTTGYKNRANGMVRIARMSESLLDDTETAGRYYRKLVEEMPSDERSYFAVEQAVRYGAFTREEVRDLNLNGFTEEIIDELFSQQQPDIL